MSISHFYKHSKMADGHLNKCKECTKIDCTRTRNENIEYYQEYDRKRANLPHRVELRSKVYKRWKEDPKLRKIHSEQHKQWRKKNEEKRSAHVLLGTALRSGK